MLIGTNYTDIQLYGILLYKLHGTICISKQVCAGNLFSFFHYSHKHSWKHHNQKFLWPLMAMDLFSLLIMHVLEKSKHCSIYIYTRMAYVKPSCTMTRGWLLAGCWLWPKSITFMYFYPQPACREFVVVKGCTISYQYKLRITFADNNYVYIYN